MGMFDFIRRRDATLPELEQQLASARAAHGKALEVVASAQAGFDAAGDLETAHALQAAHDAAQHAALHVGRAERLLAAARESAEQQRLDGLRAELAAIECELEHDAVRRRAAPLNRHFAQLLSQLVECQRGREALAAELRASASRGHSIQRELGIATGGIVVVDGVGRTITSLSAPDHLASGMPTLDGADELTRLFGETLQHLLRERTARLGSPAQLTGFAVAARSA